jgi:uncharacterized SAM-binding protein YcdF (DUF218 family)
MSTHQQKLLGLFELKPRWGLSARGWLVGATGAIIAAFAVLFLVQPFLAVVAPVETDTLVVEGWVQDHAILVAAQLARDGGYRTVLSTGGPVKGKGAYTNDYNTSASVGATRLRAAGLDPDSVHMVPSRVMARDRTYGSAVALRTWLRTHRPDVAAINVVTEGPHARRTRLLFQKALGDDVAVGVISIASPDYPARRWWQYSEGVKDVLAETVAYLYARIFFFPRDDETDS